MTPNQTNSVDTDINTNGHAVELDNTKDTCRDEKDKPNTVSLLGSYRLFVVIIATLVMTTSAASQASMSSAMVCMIQDKDKGGSQHKNDVVNYIKPNHNVSDSISSKAKMRDEAWKVQWDSKTKGWVVSSFFFGYFFMQFPSGIIVTRLGPKGSMVFGGITTGILHLITIPVAMWSLPVLYFVRTVTGLTCGFLYPGIFALVANWCPSQETSLMFALPGLGLACGPGFIFLVSFFGCQSDFQGGWPIIFYTLAGTQLVISFVILVCVTSFPTNNSFICEKEAKYISEFRVHEGKAKSIPYTDIIRSWPVWAYLMGQFAFDYAYFALMTESAIFLKDILKLHHWKVNMICSVPFLAVAPTSFIVGYLSDRLVAKKTVSRTCIRKLNETIAKVLTSASLSILVFLPVGEFVNVLIIYLVAGIGMQFSYVGFLVNPGDLSPAHSGFIIGLGQTLTTWVSFVIPIVTGNLTSKNTRDGWYIVYLIPVGFQVFCLTFYIIFGSGNVQHWATVQEDEKIPINGSIKYVEEKGNKYNRFDHHH